MHGFINVKFQNKLLHLYTVSVVRKNNTFSAYISNLCYSRHIALYYPGNHLTSIRYSVVSLSTYKKITE